LKIPEVKFLGMIFSEKRKSLNTDHIRSILELANPANKKKLLKVLGMLNYLSKFIPYYSQLTAPLRN